MIQHSAIPFLQQALALARRYQGECAPNPPVGAVLVRNGTVIAQGAHQGAGHPHAEQVALSFCSSDTRAATLYVTLEPCCHYGRTPPCTQAIVRAGITQVVYAYQDPDPRVSGRGSQQLVAAGVACVHCPLPEVDQFYRYYAYWVRYARPWVSVKLALSLDGKIAGSAGKPVALTGESANHWTHQQRQHADAIITTARTVIQDDPQLNVRIAKTVSAKPVYVLDRDLCLPSTARIINTARDLTLFHAPHLPAQQQRVWEQRGVRCVPISLTSPGAGHLSWSLILAYIGEKMGLHHVWVEAGGRCFSSLLQAQNINTAHFFIAPVLLGDAAYPLSCPAWEQRMHNAHTQHGQPCLGKVYWQQIGRDSLCTIET